ncbi:MAG: hypothetical protein ABWY02_11875 [Telluria sp.]
MGVPEALAFVHEHGVVLVSARGPVPTLTGHIAGEPIRGSWWGHPEGKRIFGVLQAVSSDPDILVCRLVGGKITLVHRRLWPALAAAAPLLDAAGLARVSQEHTARGHHENAAVPFPDWLPPEAARAAQLLDPASALATLGPTFVTNPKTRKGREKC